eukprot:m.540296 g.540296  ORF g.540296 m.540296 type:complete len:73 (+) comp22097_c0_seq3:594-812(+)
MLKSCLATNATCLHDRSVHIPSAAPVTCHCHHFKACTAFNIVRAANSTHALTHRENVVLLTSQDPTRTPSKG